MLRILKWTVIVLGTGFLLIQFVRPARTNPVADESISYRTQLQTTPEVEAILKRACLDCHSNETVWPWYSNIAPVSWLVVHDVDEGRGHMNLSEWGRYDAEKRADLLEEVCEEIEKGSMPIRNYVRAHPEAKLSDADIRALCEWADAGHERAEGRQEGQEEGKDEPGGGRRRGRNRGGRQ
jgi:hypothetical protein